MIRESSIIGNTWEFRPENVRLNPGQFSHIVYEPIGFLRGVVEKVQKAYLKEGWENIAVLTNEGKMAFVFSNLARNNVRYLDPKATTIALDHIKASVRLHQAHNSGFEIPVEKEPLNDAFADFDQIVDFVTAGHNVVNTIRDRWFFGRQEGRVLQCGVGYLVAGLIPVMDRIETLGGQIVDCETSLQRYQQDLDRYRLEESKLKERLSRPPLKLFPD